MNALPPDTAPAIEMSREQIAEYRATLQAGVLASALQGQSGIGRALMAGGQALALLDAIIRVGARIGVDRAIEQIAAQAATHFMQKVAASGAEETVVQALLDAFGPDGLGIVGSDDGDDAGEIEADGFRTFHPPFKH